MTGRRKPVNTARFISCIFMMLALAWLTISLPIVYSAQQTAEQKKATASEPQQAEEETGNPFANTTEEKTSGNSTSFSEEYLHDVNHSEHYVTELANEYSIEHFHTYIAFYGDLESPPPDLA
ncbi:MAG: hypothetical protein ABI581_11900 [Sediminibacterium sp.]